LGLNRVWERDKKEKEKKRKEQMGPKITAAVYCVPHRTTHSTRRIIYVQLEARASSSPQMTSGARRRRRASKKCRVLALGYLAAKYPHVKCASKLPGLPRRRSRAVNSAGDRGDDDDGDDGWWRTRDGERGSVLLEGFVNDILGTGLGRRQTEDEARNGGGSWQVERPFLEHRA